MFEVVVLEQQHFLGVAFLLLALQVLGELFGADVLQVQVVYGLFDVYPAQADIAVLEGVLCFVEDGLEVQQSALPVVDLLVLLQGLFFDELVAASQHVPAVEWRLLQHII